MNQVGYVTSINGDKVNVIFKRMSGCGDNCSTCSGHCESPPLILDMDNMISAKPGDVVEVVMEDDTFFKLTFFAYALPLMLMLLGIAVGYFLTKSELVSAFSGLGFLAVSYGILRIVNNKHKKERKETVSIVRIIPAEELKKAGWEV
ncbi:SoxR reducing system RseC family protein [Clostridium sp. MSJ-11]|uniref:SoxR reducing system RseC family protein n=1 Tax=Clostridium mobile TaxID=2841512 RepID=A0ABS6EDL5_9CLOT|nr:SoxR reducing system RseC family protein [Clostridium mobile]MBU5483110.1 SoxR reducing system RseC family protein [Clostridium mobile]